MRKDGTTKKRIIRCRVRLAIAAALLLGLAAFLSPQPASAAKYTKSKVQSMLSKAESNLKALKSKRAALKKKNAQAVKNVMYFAGAIPCDETNVVYYSGTYYYIPNWTSFSFAGQYLYGYVKKTGGTRVVHSAWSEDVFTCIQAKVTGAPKTTSLAGVEAQIVAAESTIKNCKNALKNKVKSVYLVKSLSGDKLTGFLKGKTYIPILGCSYRDPYSTATIKSSNKRIATINSNGKVTIKGFGKVTFSGKLSVSGKTFKKTLNIARGIEKIKLKRTSLTIPFGQTVSLPGYTLTPAKGKGTLAWTITDMERSTDDGTTLYGGKNVIEINRGKIKATTVGTATLVLKDKQNGASARCKITVQDVPKEIIIYDWKRDWLELGETTPMEVDVMGKGGTRIKNIEDILNVTVQDPSVVRATFSGNNLLVTPLKDGYSKITLTAKADPSVTDFIALTLAFDAYDDEEDDGDDDESGDDDVYHSPTFADEYKAMYDALAGGDSSYDY